MTAAYDDALPEPTPLPYLPPMRAFTRTAGDGRPGTPQGRVRALVAQIAADPVLVAWLREHGAQLLEGAAARLAESTLHDVEACEAVRKLADSHRRGDTPLW